MVAFSFMKRFADYVEDGKKPSTIRKTMRCKVGDKVQLYYGQRTKHCRKLGGSVCIGTARVEITYNAIHAFIDEYHDGVLVPDESVEFYQQEGFASLDNMIDFFRKQYGLPFIGFLHVWEPLKVKTKDIFKENSDEGTNIH